MSAPIALPDHISAAELAELRLPGLPQSERRIRALATSHGWAKIERARCKGGALYDVNALSEVDRAEWLRRLRIAAGMVQPRTANGNQPSLRRGRGRPVGTSWFARHPHIAEAVEVILATRQVSAVVVQDIIEAQFGPDACPSLPQLHREIRRIERSKGLLFEALRDPEGYKSRRRLALGTAGSRAGFAHARWEIDTTKADVMSTDEGRVCVLGIVDVYSRRLRFKVVPSESGQSVRLFLAETMVAWGAVPHVLGTDQGSGFINRSVTSALAMMAIEHDDCDPGTPEQKPFIERAFGTATRGRLRLLKGFLGHNVAEASKLRARARKETGRPVIIADITAAELQDILDNWADGRYAQTRHSGTGQTPMARMLACTAPRRAVPDADTLRIAMSASIGTAVVGKRGVQWKSGRYWADALIPFVGQTVQLRRDERELGEIFVLDADDKFICTAVNHARAGVSEAEFATAARRAQARWLAEQKAELRAKKRNFNIDDGVKALLREDAIRAGRVVELPRVPAPHSTPTLESIRPVAAAAPTPDWQRIEADRAARHAKSAPTPIDRGDQIRRADAAIAADKRGEPVDEASLKWARLFVKSSTYLTAKAMAAARAKGAKA